MVLCLRKQQEMETTEAVSLVLSWLKDQHSIIVDHDDDSSSQERDLVIRDMICMLGCSTDASLTEVTSTLLTTSSSSDDSLLVRAERLNVLVDLFADDHRHAVFQQLLVLPFLQAELPVLQRQLAVRCRSEDVDDEIVQETAMNVSQFIKYKKNYR
jgi:hypothetical protein